MLSSQTSSSRIAKKVPHGGTTLLIVDPQNDFHEGGSLAVPGSSEDLERISSLIEKSLDDSSEESPKIDRIVVTLDSHHKLDIAHPTFWVDENGNHPEVFTTIKSEDIQANKWTPRDNLKLPIDDNLLDMDILDGGKGLDLVDKDGNIDLSAYCHYYAKALESKGKFTLMIWPPHCLIGTTGHCVPQTLVDAMDKWSGETGTTVEFVHKGQNLLTEMYSALSAEVPISSATSFNNDLFDSLNKSEKILVAGQALSHCVNHTVRDLLDHMSEKEKSKVYILEDCASSVPAFEEAGAEFIKHVKDTGGNVCKVAEVAP